MSELRGPVIIASDLSEQSTQTLLAGVALARQLETSWSVCHVVPEAFRVRVLFPHEAGIGPDSQREISARAVLALSSQIRRKSRSKPARLTREFSRPLRGKEPRSSS
jgi:hypothetical protein